MQQEQNNNSEKFDEVFNITSDIFEKVFFRNLDTELQILIDKKKLNQLAEATS